LLGGLVDHFRIVGLEADANALLSFGLGCQYFVSWYGIVISSRSGRTSSRYN
jgi:hypothetical protein